VSTKNDDNNVYMSDALMGNVDLSGQRDLVDNTVILVIQNSNGRDAIVGGMRYFRREEPSTSLEVTTSLDSVTSMIVAIEGGQRTANVEFHRGEEVILRVEEQNVVGYYTSDVDPLSGQVTFGLKLLTSVPQVL
jgi:hypothetical protein